jgi:hypothetical protein
METMESKEIFFSNNLGFLSGNLDKEKIYYSLPGLPVSL